MSRRIRLVFVSVLFFLCADLFAAERPKVAVVLGGGGAKGVAEVALLEVLEEEGIPVDMILGTSMGALIGSFYACGYSAREVEAIVGEIDMMGAINESSAETVKNSREPYDYYRDNIYSIDFTSRGIGSAPALLGDQKVLNILSRYTRKLNWISDFDQLPIPFRCVCTDIFTGEAKVCSSGSLLYASRASMSLPVIFTPTPTEDGSLAFDGCFSNNLPIEEAKKMGADIIIAMDVASLTNQTKEDLSDINTIAVHAFNLMVNPKSIAQYKMADILIDADISQYGMMDYLYGKEIIQAGYRAVEKQRDEIHQLALKLEKQGVVLEKKDLDRVSYYSSLEYPVIEGVEIRNISYLGDCILPKASDYSGFVGKKLDDEMVRKLEKKNENLRYLYNLSSLSYEMKQGSSEGSCILLISANHFEQKKDTITIGGNPQFSVGKSDVSSAHPTLSTEMTMGLSVKRKLPLDIYAKMGDEYELQMDIVPAIKLFNFFDAGLDIGGGVKGGSLAVNDSLFYSDSIKAMDFGADAQIGIKAFYIDYASFDAGIKYDFEYIDSVEEQYSMIYLYSGFLIDTLRNYGLGMNGYRIDSMIRGGIGLPDYFLYSGSFDVRQRFELIEDVNSIGYDLRVCVNKFPYKLKTGYADYGGYNGLCGYSSGSYAKDFALLGLQYQHRLFSIADIPLYAIGQVRAGLRGDYEPFGAEEESSDIPFYMEDLWKNIDVGFGGYLGIDTPVGNLVLGGGYALDGSWVVMFGIM